MDTPERGLDDPRAVDFLTDKAPAADAQRLAHGARQRAANLASSLTTTSSVVAALNSLLTGALAGDVAALAGAGPSPSLAMGFVVSLVSGALHVRYAAR